MVKAEFCFSVDEFEWLIKRPEFVKVEYYNEHGEYKKEELDALRSRVIQHEMDHIDGKLMTELPGAVRKGKV